MKILVTLLFTIGLLTAFAPQQGFSKDGANASVKKECPCQKEMKCDCAKMKEANCACQKGECQCAKSGSCGKGKKK